MGGTSQAHAGRNARPNGGDDQLYQAAVLYYEEDATQAEIAQRLGISRPAVSRILSEARSRGIVTIQVHRPQSLDTDALADLLRQQLGLKRVWVAPTGPGPASGITLAGTLRQALVDVSTATLEGLLISPGRTLWEAASQPMPTLSGVIVAPTAGGMDEPEPYYQTNEITRLFAASTGGAPWFLYAPALPGPALRSLLAREPSISRVLDLWQRAKVALLGVGAPTMTRTSHPSVLPKYLPQMSAAVGDICLRPYDREGQEIPFPGSDQLVSMRLEQLKSLEWAIAVAAGPGKTMSITAAARGGHINALVTDAATATAILEAGGT